MSISTTCETLQGTIDKCDHCGQAVNSSIPLFYRLNVHINECMDHINFCPECRFEMYRMVNKNRVTGVNRIFIQG